MTKSKGVLFLNNMAQIYNQAIKEHDCTCQTCGQVWVEGPPLTDVINQPQIEALKQVREKMKLECKATRCRRPDGCPGCCYVDGFEDALAGIDQQIKEIEKK